MAQPATTIVYPKPGVTVFRPGGTHGFTSGPVPLPASHAEQMHAAGHVMTEAEKTQADADAKAKAKADLAKAQAEEKDASAA